MAKKRESIKKGRTVHIELSSAGLFLWVGGLFFLLVWIFALGIFVGRESLEGEIKAVARLKEFIQREESNPGNASELAGKTPEGPELAFYEKLETKKDEAWKNNTAKPRKPATSAVPGAVKERENRAEARRVPAKVREEPRAPARKTPLAEKTVAAPATSRGDDSIAPAAGSGAMEALYTVQIAALERRDMAERMVDRLRSKGHPAYYYDATIKGKTYFRVRCGRFLSRSEAEDYAGRLLKKEGIRSFVSELE